MNTAQVIVFPTQASESNLQEAKDMDSNKFQQGYVMSSRMYRQEVWPFLSDAARNVYAELENRIYGRNKQADFVSHSQLQGGELVNSRKLSRGTVSDGVKELLKKGVISIIGSGLRGVKKYQINEISLVQQCDSRTSQVIQQSNNRTSQLAQQSDTRTSGDTELVHLSNRTSSGSAPVTSSGSEHTIDNKDILEEEEEERAREIQKLSAQNRSLNFVEYHPDDRSPISLKQLFKKYPAQVNFVDQAKISFPDHSVDQIFSELQRLGQWSLSASNLMPQKWMSVWLDWMKKIPTATEQAAANARQTRILVKPNPEQPKFHQYGQAKPQPAMRDVGGSHE